MDRPGVDREYCAGKPALIIATVGSALIAGCGLFVDSYNLVDEPADAGGTGTVELPLLPARPDPDFVDSCEACARDRCGQYYDACLQSERCKALLACHGTCSDPNCIYRCRDTEPESATFEDYFGCVFGSFGDNAFAPESACPEECNARANWACKNNYVWGPYEPGQATVDVTVHWAPGLAAGGPLDAYLFARIAGCEEALPNGGVLEADVNCDPPQPVDTYGTAHLTLGGRRTAFVLRGFRVGDVPGSRIYDRPILRSGRLELRAFAPIIRDAWLPQQVANLTPPIEVRPDQGMIFFFTKDCTGVYSNARVEIAAGPGSPVRIYWRGYGALDTVSEWGSGIFVNVPPGPSVGLSAHHPITGEPIARHTLLVAGGWSTEVVLLPLPRP